MRRLALAVLVSVCAISCDKDDPGPQDLVTYTLDVDRTAWLFASGPDGKVLDWKQLEYKQPVSLTAPNPPDSFSITMVLMERSRPLFLSISTYTGIEPGSVFAPSIYDPEEPENAEQEGKVTIQVTNYPDQQELPLIVADEFQSTSYTSTGTNTPTFLMSVWKSKTSQFLVNGYDGDMLHPVYKYIDTPGAGSTAQADFKTFMPYDKTIDIKGFDTDMDARLAFTMFGSDDDLVNGVQFSEFTWDYKGISPVAKVGYLDDFNNYTIELRLYEFDKRGVIRSRAYRNNGPITKPIVLPNDQLTMNNSTLAGLSFSFSGNYQMRMHNYTNETSASAITWTVYSGFGDPSPIKEIPGELLSMYPDMDLNSFVYVGSSFYSYDDDYTYKKFIQDVSTTSFGPVHPGYEQAFFK